MAHDGPDRLTPPATEVEPRSALSRRTFMQTLGLSAAAGALNQAGEEAAAAQTAVGPRIVGPGPVKLALRVNGKPTELHVEPATTLLEALRLHLGLTGAKEICDRGSCGGCSVLVDGKLITSCMMLALDADGCAITTIEGLAQGDELHPLQESFVRHVALQCGYCTPGFIMASQALLQQNATPTLDEIKKGLGGNLCRCATYNNILNAVLEASGQEPLRDTEG
ncbi:MAG: (2Fe-2S)-binding protein [Phycisphaerales bacterium JB038]